MEYAITFEIPGFDQMTVYIADAEDEEDAKKKAYRRHPGCGLIVEVKKIGNEQC